MNAADSGVATTKPRLFGLPRTDCAGRYRKGLNYVIHSDNSLVDVSFIAMVAAVRALAFHNMVEVCFLIFVKNGFFADFYSRTCTFASSTFLQAAYISGIVDTYSGDEELEVDATNRSAENARIISQLVGDNDDDISDEDLLADDASQDEY